jgi:hypothetical protein
MINHRIAHRARALLVFVQQLAHLLDRERSILPVERLLTFTLIKEGPVLRVRTASDLFVRLRGIARTARRASWIRRISDCLLLRNSRCAAGAVERLRIELSRRKVAGPGKTLGVRLFLDIKCANGCLFIYGCAIGAKLFVLRIIPQRRVRPKEPIDEFAFLVLSMDARESNQEH